GPEEADWRHAADVARRLPRLRVVVRAREVDLRVAVTRGIRLRLAGGGELEDGPGGVDRILERAALIEVRGHEWFVVLDGAVAILGHHEAVVGDALEEEARRHRVVERAARVRRPSVIRTPLAESKMSATMQPKKVRPAESNAR